MIKAKRRQKKHKVSVKATAPQKHDALSDRGMRAYAELATRDPRFKILYLIPHQSQDLKEHSVFGWYTSGLHQSAELLMSAAVLPKDIRELFSAPKDIFGLRITRLIWSNLIPIQLDALKAGANLFGSPFLVFISNESTVASEIDTFRSEFYLPCLHVSSVEGNGRVLINEFNLYILLDYCKKVVKELSSVPEWSTFARSAKTEIENKHLRKTNSHLLPLGFHNVTYPNESALTAFGWKLERVKPISVPFTTKEVNPQHYVDRICRSANAVMTARAQLMRQMLPAMLDYRYIIAIQSMYWGHFINWRQRISNFKEKNAAALRFTFRLTVKATTYYDPITEKDREFINNPIFQVSQKQRAADALAFTAGLTILSTASLAPVLRLEPKLNQIRGELKQIASCARSANSHRSQWKQSRMVRRLSEQMRSLINPSFLACIDQQEKFNTIEGLKLVTDLPLELMRSRDLPLLLRFDTSRLPVIPGNLYLRNCIMPAIFLPLSAFHEILIVRSFKKEDPLRKILDVCISTFLDDVNRSGFLTKTLIIDVQNENEFVEALNSYNGALMIFDGHGSYDSEIGTGTIIIGNNRVNAWELKERCSFPPIVVFSACDTQSLDGSHGSIATAAFTLGAHTVLGTTLPVDGVKAGVFIGRLLLRISEFMPNAIKSRSFLTWREVISGMLRMMHITEVIIALNKNAGKIYQGIDFHDVQLSTNIAINQRSPEWYERFLVVFSALTKQTIDELKHDIDQWASITDSMKYVQLGNPENIVIVEQNATDIFQEEVKNVENKLFYTSKC